MRKSLLLSVLSAGLLAPFAGPALRAAPDGPKPAAAADDAAKHAEREAWFAKLLTNAVLAGQYNMGPNGAPKQDRYTILKAVKGEGENWVITAKVEYKGLSLPIDLTLPVKWAGDTPVISLTDMKIPGFGTFTARVMFYGDQYAGTWSAGGDHGGLMWGHIEHPNAKPASKPAE